MDQVTAFLIAVIPAATPLLLAALGELVSERAGVLNLGVEGMMLVGAVTGFAVTVTTGSAISGVGAAMLASAILALGFAFLTLTLMANQVASGLALTILGTGAAALIGAGFVGMPVERLPHLDVPGLSDLPVVGPLLFAHDALVYLSLILALATGLFLNRTRAGLILRACGEDAGSAHALGHPVILTRYLAVLFGGAMAGLAGAFLSLSYTPMWSEAMTAGRGWIALALVVFASWRPGRLVLGAYLFGGLSILQLYAQNMGILALPSQVFAMTPYLVTILVLILISLRRARSATPASLGQSFRATQ
ncbi:nucleoside ABC transporter membrane protein [Arboricoccus pini]|uniref:Nucleoside ABC transporter membrane protein n=1 Tax=Arboricoccus pini TaxID=1963835 RepID=A0A212QCE0_9PROT|nr:ABC transporter permease [Arboricoccus pini]SNB56887.1 nucleoside ABC transporter membrane protein [Arboricoccus pini]